MKEYLIKTSPNAREKIFFRVEVWDFEGRERRFLYSSVMAEGSEEAEHFLTQLYWSMFEGKPVVEVMGEREWLSDREAQSASAAVSRETALEKDRERKRKAKKVDVMSVTEELVSVEVGK